MDNGLWQPVSVQNMSTGRPKRDSMSLEETTISNMWEIAARQKAKHAASDLVFGKELTLHTFEKDKYGRTISDVRLPDGMNVNHELVKEGWGFGSMRQRVGS